MYLSKLLLENFRSYDKKLFEFSPQTNLLLGPNGSGKTNILESIYFLSSGKSFRSSSSGQLLKWDTAYTSVRGKIADTEIEVQLYREPQKLSLSRKMLIDKVQKTRKDYLGILKVVVFEPEDIRLIGGSPTRRRDFLDSIFLTSEWRYASSLSQYHRALQHRNELLDLIRDGKSAKAELFYWDQSLVKNAEIIEDYRQKFVRSANTYFSHHENPEIQQLSLKYLPSIINQERLEQNYHHELMSGFTLSGPHRDDFSVNNSIFGADDKNLAFWGSRGQQRLAVLAIRLAQINYLEETYNQKPILLLDDIFSELDPDHQQLVVNICQKYQTIITSADDFLISKLPTAQILKI